MEKSTLLSMSKNNSLKDCKKVEMAEFKCDICDKKFESAYEAKKHFAEAHPKI